MSPRPTASMIPVGTQFSPDLVDLRAFLKAIRDNSGDRERLQEAVWRPPVHLRHSAVPSSRRRANLPLEAAVQYGMLTPRTYEATPLVDELLKHQGLALNEAFAKHILLNLGGLRVVKAIQKMEADRVAGLSTERVTGDSLSRFLTAEGFRVTEHNTAINSLRMWLSKAGVFPERGWTVDLVALSRLIPLSDETISVLTTFSPGQRAFVEALCAVSPVRWYPAAHVRDMAETRAGIRLGRSSLPKEVLEPLSRAGLIEFRTRGTSGGKTAELKVTPSFRAEVLKPFIAKAVESLDPELAAYYEFPATEMYLGLESSDRYRKGRALEAFGIHVMRLLGLRLLGWRKRAQDTTGQAEIDVVLAGVMGGIPTVWQVQCKNTPGSRVDLEDVAKEVGATSITRATHVLLIANALITEAARDFAREVMRTSALSVFLLDRDDFASIQRSPASMGSILRAQAHAIVDLRRSSGHWGNGRRQ